MNDERNPHLDKYDALMKKRYDALRVFQPPSLTGALLFFVVFATGLSM